MFGIGGAGGKGIIPAYAGNTKEYLGDDVYGRDHPRVCGEHLVFAAVALSTVGSSPRMRGTPVTDYRGATYHGIIPAYAGNTNACTSPSEYLEDHPRVCGEHHQQPRKELTMTGSSPRMRGTRRPDKRVRWVRGIIPAYAGNTLRDYSNFVVSKFMSFVFHLV